MNAWMANCVMFTLTRLSSNDTFTVDVRLRRWACIPQLMRMTIDSHMLMRIPVSVCSKSEGSPNSISVILIFVFIRVPNVVDGLNVFWVLWFFPLMVLMWSLWWLWMRQSWCRATLGNWFWLSGWFLFWIWKCASHGAQRHGQEGGRWTCSLSLQLCVVSTHISMLIMRLIHIFRHFENTHITMWIITLLHTFPYLTSLPPLR